MLPTVNTGSTSHHYPAQTDAHEVVENEIETRSSSANNSWACVSQNILAYQIPKKLQCPDCLKYFRNAGNLSLHRKVHKPAETAENINLIQAESSPNRAARCEADIEYDNCMKWLKESIKPHPSDAHLATGSEYPTTSSTKTTPPKKVFLCPICAKSFSLKQNLKNHQRIHSGEKPYQCEQEGCGKCFSDMSALKSHKLVHSGEKPYLCLQPNCNKKYQQYSGLQYHLKTFHKLPSILASTSGQDDDTETIVTTSSKKETKTHSNEKKFKCEQCDKDFSRKDNLIRHKAMHSDKKEFKCNRSGCGKSFKYLAGYKTHIRTHDSNNLFICQVEGCNKIYKYHSGLSNHQKLTHQ